MANDFAERLGKTFEQKTYVTHAWLITDLDDNGWYVIRPEAKSPKIEIETPKLK